MKVKFTAICVNPTYEFLVNLLQMAYVQVGSGQTTSTVTETETETETESNHSSILAAWGDDPEIQEKVRYTCL